MGHFLIVPNIFNNGNYIPLVFLLLPNKKTNIHEQVYFNSLINWGMLIEIVHIHFQPKICIVDFEQSI